MNKTSYIANALKWFMNRLAISVHVSIHVFIMSQEDNWQKIGIISWEFTGSLSMIIHPPAANELTIRSDLR